jgi:hypothetical protein
MRTLQTGEVEGGTRAGRIIPAAPQLEVPAGVAFILAPSVGAKLFSGSRLDGLIETNLAGSALLGLGLAFWRGRNDGQALAARGLAVAMLVYSAGVALLLVTSAVGSHRQGFVPGCDEQRESRGA